MFLPQRTEATISTSDSSEKQDIKEQTTEVFISRIPSKTIILVILLILG
ncbi:hypothetical protein CCAN11_1130016 [Capnocytophaga canimorsus]|uniref:Uncharacterized protein n=1 Tax=Capnocytophaga canimorsus TaxID=28188 RepID=A0A0B7I7E4_9FLAO|nr:hypothetical protein CCAN11_1130016 [Capnocytophaga canimorsus]